jgi:hypothetical protein
MKFSVFGKCSLSFRPYADRFPRWERRNGHAVKASVPPKYGDAGAFLAAFSGAAFSRGEVSPKSEIKN